MITRIALKKFGEGEVIRNIDRDTVMTILKVSYMRFELSPSKLQSQTYY